MDSSLAYIGLIHSYHGLISGTHFYSSHFLLDIVTSDLRTTGLIFIMDSSLACIFITYLSLCGIDLSVFQFFYLH
ncbi:hypothetical protein DEU56DRAFT_812050, partial [Suillus clintonianus]|uniref:uncharacterized protein n=1 Tax=Suillus clintonianus TaxID=1904413 RepID=UPI001B866E56